MIVQITVANSEEAHILLDALREAEDYGQILFPFDAQLIDRPTDTDHE